MKWVGGFAKNSERGLPNITGVQICNDIETGVPLAIMDCAYLTGLRTAAVSACSRSAAADSRAGCIWSFSCGRCRTAAKCVATTRPGAAAALAERARSAGYLRGKHQADKFIVDDIPLAEYFQKISIGRKNDHGEDNPEFPGGIPPVYSAIGDIIAGKKAGRESAQERIIAIPIGMAICDIALGHLVYQRARARGVGQKFRLA